MCIFFLKKEYYTKDSKVLYTKSTIQNVYHIVLTPSQTIQQMGTHRRQTVQTQDGTEILQIKKCCKLDCLKALKRISVDIVPY